jgi:hypothetical protein
MGQLGVPKLDPFFAGFFVSIPLVGVAVYWLWIFPIRNGIRAARATGRSPHWMWLAVHPVFGWPVYMWMRRRFTGTSVGFDSLPTWSRRLALSLMLLYAGLILVGLITDAGAFPSQVVAIVILGGMTWFPLLRGMSRHDRTRRLLKWLGFGSWVVGPLGLITMAFVGDMQLTLSSSGAGALIGLVVALLLVFSGFRQERTVWRDAVGRAVATTPWRTTGSFVGAVGGLLTLVLLPVAGALIGAAYQGGALLGLW